MRILQVVQTPQRRGAEVFAFQLSDWLRTQGFEVRTAYLYRYDGDTSLPLQSGDVLCGARSDHPCERVPGFQPALLQQLRAILSRYAPDVVQLNGARTVKYGALLRLSDARTRYKLIYRNIDSPAYWVRDPIRRFLVRRIFLPRMDGVIGVSRKTLAEVERLFRPPGVRIYIPNGVDLNGLRPSESGAVIRRRLTTPLNAVVALFAGTLTRQKRPDRFLRAIACASESTDALYGWLLGDGPDRAGLEIQAAALGVTDRVRFIGYQENVASYIAAADFHVSTSDTEGVPAVVVESAYLGKPTLGHRVGGMHECVLHGDTGYLVDPGDDDALVHHIVNLARSVTDRVRLGERARQWSEDTFSLDRVARQYLDFYNCLCTGDPRGGPNSLAEVVAPSMRGSPSSRRPAG